MTWRERAACIGRTDIDWHEGDPAPAVALCGVCKVRDDCLQDALTESDLQFGIRGGLTPAERHALRGRVRVRHGTPGGYQAHFKIGQDPCPECIEAHRVYKRKLREESA
jgi:hypothetical protein